jgi:DNA-binding winged helix-turn-helix (wHTH) protein
MRYFPPFRFDSPSGLLWREDQQVPITRKAAQLLDCLVERAGVVVEHDEIMRCVWGDTHVQPDNIKVLVHELRTAFSARSAEAEYIRTAPGRGYMFVGALTDAPIYSPTRPEGAFVGRAAELEEIAAIVARSIATCESQVFLVEGDRGMGKTMLCDALIYRVRDQSSLRILRGQAFESTAAIESDGALIDAIDLFSARHPDVQLSPPTPATPEWLEGIVHPAEGAIVTATDGTPKLSPRLIRHLVGILENLAHRWPLLVILEDVQLGDAITLECLRAMVRRPVGARLTVVATYARNEHKALVDELDRMGRELRLQRRGGSLRLSPLTPAEVALSLERRIGAEPAADLKGPLFRATEGHPLLVSSAIDALDADLADADRWTARTLAQSLVVLEDALALGVRCQIDRLTADDRIVLETAAVIGLTFSAADVAAGLACEQPGPISRRLDTLAANRTLIGPADGSGGDRTYRFRHGSAIDMLTEPLPLARVIEVATRVRRSSTRPGSAGTVSRSVRAVK